MSMIPPPPPGFVLDTPMPAVPPPPPGFQIDPPAAPLAPIPAPAPIATSPAPLAAPAPVIPPPPPGFELDVAPVMAPEPSAPTATAATAIPAPPPGFVLDPAPAMEQATAIPQATPTIPPPPAGFVLDAMPTTPPGEQPKSLDDIVIENARLPDPAHEQERMALVKRFGLGAAATPASLMNAYLKQMPGIPKGLNEEQNAAAVAQRKWQEQNPIPALFDAVPAKQKAWFQKAMQAKMRPGETTVGAVEALGQLADSIPASFARTGAGLADFLANNPEASGAMNMPRIGDVINPGASLKKLLPASPIEVPGVTDIINPLTNLSGLPAGTLPNLPNVLSPAEWGGAATRAITGEGVKPFKETQVAKDLRGYAEKKEAPLLEPGTTAAKVITTTGNTAATVAPVIAAGAAGGPVAAGAVASAQALGSTQDRVYTRLREMGKSEEEAGRLANLAGGGAGIVGAATGGLVGGSAAKTILGRIVENTAEGVAYGGLQAGAEEALVSAATGEKPDLMRVPTDAGVGGALGAALSIFGALFTKGRARLRTEFEKRAKAAKTVEEVQAVVDDARAVFEATEAAIDAMEPELTAEAKGEAGTPPPFSPEPPPPPPEGFVLDSAAPDSSPADTLQARPEDAETAERLSLQEEMRSEDNEAARRARAISLTEQEIRQLPNERLRSVAQDLGVTADARGTTIPRILDAQRREKLAQRPAKDLYWEVRNRGLKAGTRDQNIETLLAADRLAGAQAAADASAKEHPDIATGSTDAGTLKRLPAPGGSSRPGEPVQSPAGRLAPLGTDEGGARQARETEVSQRPDAAPDQSRHEQYSNIDRSWVGKQLYDWGGVVTLAKGQKARGDTGRPTRQFPLSGMHELERVNRDSKSLLGELRNRTDEVWDVRGKAGGYFLAPRRAVAAAMESLKARGIDPEAEVIQTRKAREERKAKIQQDRTERERRIGGVGDELVRQFVMQTGRAPDTDAAWLNPGDPKRHGTLRDAIAWSKEQPQDSTGYALGYIFEHAKQDRPGTIYQWVQPANLADGTEILVGDEKFTVEHDPDSGEVMLHDGITVRVDESTTIPARELREGELPAVSEGDPFADLPEDSQAEAPRQGLFGQEVFDAATGNNQGGLFHEPVQVQGPTRTGDDAKIAGRFDEAATPEMFNVGNEEAAGPVRKMTQPVKSEGSSVAGASPDSEAAGSRQNIVPRPHPVKESSPLTVEAYRGVPGNGDPSAPGIGGGRFFSPDALVARGYADSGRVVKETLTFERPFVAENWMKAKERLGLPQSAGMADVIQRARQDGHDGIIFERHNGKPEYVDLRNAQKATPAEVPPPPPGFVLDQPGAAGGADTAARAASPDNSPSSLLADRIVAHLNDAGSPALDTPGATRLAREAFGGTAADGKYSGKDVSDAVELGVNRWLKQSDIDATAPLDRAIQNVATLEQALSRLPTQSWRTQESERFQQFSTPPHYSYAAAWVANIKKADTFLEPSAGTGSLAVYGVKHAAHTVANELSPRRAELVKALGVPEVHVENAEQIGKILAGKVKPTVVVMNPPFSQTAGRMGGKKDLLTGAKHIQEALDLLPDGGRLVAIVGRGMSFDAPTFKSWWNRTRQQYAVRANIGVDGAVYRKYGTAFGTRLLVIDKSNPLAAPPVTGEVANVVELMSLLHEVRDGRVPPAKLDPSQPGLQGQASGSGTLSGSPPPVRPSTPRMGDGGIGDRTSGEIPDRAAALNSGAVQQPKPGDPISGAGASGSRGAGGRVGNDVASGSGPGAAGESGARTQPDVASLENVGSGTPVEQADFSDAVFEGYRPQRIGVAGAKPHPSKLVESSAMATVSLPAVDYTPRLHKALIDQGKLSEAQLESIVYAGAAHNEMLPAVKDVQTGEEVQYRRGFFIGDGTGVGKGAEIAGIFTDNWNQGRRKGVWVSKNYKLYSDALRDWTWVGKEKASLLRMDKFKIGAKIEADEGVIFAPYGTLRSGLGKAEKSRVQQLVDWLGKDFDGVIAFDEAHSMKGAIAQKGKRGTIEPSQIGLAGVDLQKALPNARVVYVSATGATEVANLGYASRLGLWGPGTPFDDANKFATEIHAGGLAAMELVARDMKQAGSYLARQLSFDGTEQDRLTHNLTPEQSVIYDKLAEAWGVVLRNINEALELTAGQETRSGTVKVDGKAKSAALGQFYGTQQRFFNQVITSLKMPTILKDIEAEVAKGNAAVLQLVNTNEASQDRSIASLAEDDSLEDLDMTPRDALIEMVKKSFPVNQLEQYTDENGNVRMRPVLSADGSTVQNPQAVAMRERLVEELASIRVPDGPLEMLLNHFGPDRVAEVTGRSKRVVRVRAKDGSERTVVEPRSESKALADAAAFQAGKKNILVFSKAGGTGASYHADKKATNQRRRIHYLIQPGWIADDAMQGFGRTHRSGEVSQPVYRLTQTDLNGEKRFVSSIARRLDQLGAITRGQRQAANQGMFNELDNLESPMAQRALQRLVEDIAGGRVEWLSAEDFQTSTGIVLMKEDRSGPRLVTPEMPRFLNRLLSLSIEKQNRLFDEFVSRYRQTLDIARETGELDVGIEVLKADTIKKVKEQTVYTDPRTKAETKLVTLDVGARTQITAFTQAAGFANVFFAKNVVSGQVGAFTPAGSKTSTDTGRIETYYRRHSPTGSSLVKDVEIDRGKNWTRLDKEAARPLWEQQAAKAPEFRKSQVHLLTGVILPIWDKIGGNVSVKRLQTDDGERLLGRLIETDDVATTLSALGATDDAPQITPAQAFERASLGDTLHLTDDWQVKTKRVAGEPRMELVGPNYTHHDRLRAAGAVLEKQGYQTRVFIPAGADGARILQSILAMKPLKRVAKTRGGDDASDGPRQTRPPGTRPGFVDISPLEGPVKLAAAAAKFPKGAIDWWSKPLIETVEAQAGDYGKGIARQMRYANDRAREITGRLHPTTKAYSEAVSGAPGRDFSARRQAVTALQERVEAPSGEYAFSRGQLAVEGGIPLDDLTPQERRIVTLRRQLTREIGEIAVEQGILVIDQNGQAPRPFVPATDGARWIRALTPEFYALADLPDGNPMKLAMAKAIADANGIDEPMALRHINEQAKPLFKRNATETVRVLKHFPAWVKNPETGRWVEVLNTDPFSSGRSMVENAAKRLGYASVFGQDIPGEPGSAEMVERFGAAGGHRPDLERALQALNGIPVDRIDLGKLHPVPGTPEFEAMRALGTVYNVAKSAALTTAAVPNLLEPITKTFAFAGAGPWARAVWAIARHPIASREMTAAIGGRTVDKIRWMSRPGRKFQDIGQAISNVLTAPLRFVNEWNELHAAQTGIELAKDIRAGKHQDAARVTLDVLGFSEPQIERIVNGRGHEDEYRAIATRFAERTQGSTSSPSEKSRAGNSGLWRLAVPFDQWAQMTVNRFAKTHAAWYRAVESGDPGRAFAATRMLGRFWFGHAAAGAGAAFIYAWLSGGMAGVDIRASEAKDDPGDFLTDALLNGLLGGVAGRLYRAIDDPRTTHIGQGLESLSYPAMFLQDAVEVFNGWGRYKDLGPTQRVGQFLGNRFAARHAVATVMATFGLGEADPARDAAVSAFYRWKREQKDLSRRIGGEDLPAEDHVQFRRAMKSAMDAIKRHDEKAAQQAVRDALGLSRTDSRSVVASIRARELLTKLDDDQRHRLRNRIGDDAYQQLEAYDDLLEGWAQSLAFETKHNEGVHARHGQALLKLDKARDEIAPAWKAVKTFRDAGDVRTASRLANESRDVLEQKPLVDAQSRGLAKARKLMKSIEADTRIQPDEKRRRLAVLDGYIGRVLAATSPDAVDDPADQAGLPTEAAAPGDGEPYIEDEGLADTDFAPDEPEPASDYLQSLGIETDLRVQEERSARKTQMERTKALREQSPRLQKMLEERRRLDRVGGLGDSRLTAEERERKNRVDGGYRVYSRHAEAISAAENAGDTERAARLRESLNMAIDDDARLDFEEELTGLRRQKDAFDAAKRARDYQRLKETRPKALESLRLKRLEATDEHLKKIEKQIGDGSLDVEKAAQRVRSMLRSIKPKKAA